MTYQMYITRAVDHHDAASDPIAEAEWESMAEVNPMLFRTSPPSVSPAVYAATFPDDTDAFLYWERGLILVDGVATDENAFRLTSIAIALDAHLVGEDGESYMEDSPLKK